MYCCQIFLFRITDFVLMLHSLMFEVIYNVVLLVFLFAWKGKCHCNTDVHHTFLLAWWEKKRPVHYIFSSENMLFVCILFSVDILFGWRWEVLEKRRKITWWQTTSAMHRPMAKIVFWLHGHIPRAHNIHVMYNFEHHGCSSWCPSYCQEHTFFRFCAKTIDIIV